MIFDLRIYTLHHSKIAAYLRMYEQYAYPTQIKYLGKPVLYGVTEVGTLNQAVHVWGYESQADRESKRNAMFADPVWQEFMGKNAELGAHIHQESRILKSTSFSPL